MHKVNVYYHSEDSLPLLEELSVQALKFGIGPEAFKFDSLSQNSLDETYIELKDDQFSLVKSKVRVKLDWKKDFLKHKSKKYAISKELLSRAIGGPGKIKGKFAEEIIEGTLGTGKDSILLLSFGYKLCSFERDPHIFLLCLSEYLKLGSFFHEEGISFRINFGDVKDLKKSLLENSVVYFDPMYPIKKKSALSRKEMELFKEHVGEDRDREQVLKFLIENAKRVVFKRSAKLSSPLSPNCTFSGKTTSYDRFER